MTLFSAVVLIAATQVPDSQGADVIQRLTSYGTSADHCDAKRSIASTPLLAPDDPRVISTHPGSSLAFYRSQYSDVNHDLREAITQRREALRLASADESEERNDFLIRLPLSIDLMHVGALNEARREWKTMLTRRPTNYETPGLELLERGAYATGFRSLRRRSPVVNQEFEDSGAAKYLERGIIYAAARRYDQAVGQWQLSSECSPSFGWPHLLLGFIATMRKHPDWASSEWLATLGAYEPRSPETAFLSMAQYSALSMLTR